MACLKERVIIREDQERSREGMTERLEERQGVKEEQI